MYKLWVQQCIIIIWTIVLVIVYSSKSKAVKVVGFAVIFDRI